MRTVLFTSLAFLVLVLFCGCRVYSWIVMENPEFPETIFPTDLKPEILNKYSVGDVIVHPRILYTDGSQTAYELFIVFFSKMNTSTVSIKAVTISVDGEKLNYGSKIISESVSAWEPYLAKKAFYVSSISGNPIDLPKAKIVRTRADISLQVSVKDVNGDIIEKKIKAYFVPKKRRYLE